jgi:hypothetical protein
MNYYLLDFECIKCPEWGQYSLAVFLFLGVLAIYTVYVLSERNEGLASTLAVIFHHYQLLSVFFAMRLKYPPEILKAVEVRTFLF